MMRIVTTSWGNGRRKRTVVFTAAVAVALFAVGFFYRRFILSGLDLVAAGTGGRTSAALCLLLALLVLAWLLVWLSFPLFVFFGLRALSRRTAELDRTLKSCVQQLERTAESPKNENKPQQQEPSARP